MDDFIWTESPGSSLELVPRVGSTSFGDGYAQDAPDGLNAVQQVWDLAFTDIETAMADEIVAFLQPGLGWKRFNYVPPRQTATLRFKCTSLRRTPGSRIGEDSISARFEQVFEP